jgi:2-dehydro-3-deoxygluconokinase
MATVVTFGEIMMRLATKRFERFVQAREFEVTYGGGEANVAVTLANFGTQARYVTALPNNDLGKACEAYIRQFGVDTSHIAWQGNRLGIYFLENGAVQRGSKVVYDRAGSSIAEITTGVIDWDAAFEGVDWFHWTGITPAISQGAADVCLEAIQAARAKGVTVSADLNYRKNLWKYGKKASEVMPDLVALCDVAIGNEEDADKVFGIKAEGADVEGGKVEAEAYRSVAEGLVAKFPSLKQVAITLRGSISASHNTWSGILYQGGDVFVGPLYDITHIVDRVGGGDSFMGGLIFAMLDGRDPQACIDFAVAASCLKHSIHGDFNLVTVSEVEGLLKGGGGGRVQR